MRSADIQDTSRRTVVVVTEAGDVFEDVTNDFGFVSFQVDLSNHPIATELSVVGDEVELANRQVSLAPGMGVLDVNIDQ